jgi:peptide/nickel transport system permease protein
LWALAWRRLRADRVAMASLAVVLAFLLMVVLSACGLIVADWEQEVAVSYAPPSLPTRQPSARLSRRPRRRRLPDNVFDPIADDIRALRAQLAAPQGHGGTAPGAVEMYGVVDPLADDLAALRAQAGEGARACS